MSLADLFRPPVRTPCQKCLDRAEACLKVAEALHRAINAVEEAASIKYMVSLEIKPFVEKWLPSEQDIELAEAQVRVGQLSGKTEKDIQAINLTITKGLRDQEKEWRQGAEAFKRRAELCHEITESVKS